MDFDIVTEYENSVNCDQLRERGCSDAQLISTERRQKADGFTGDESPTIRTDGSAVEPRRRLCSVCEGQATGYHYGVPSCEACKAFFKRTVQRNLSYTCTEDGKCEVFHGKRRTCQSCRYDKCIAVGMMINGVRLNRSKGGRQAYRRRPDERDFISKTTRKKQATNSRSVADFCQRLLEIEPSMLKMTLPDGDWGTGAPRPGRTPMQKIWMELMAEVADRALTTTVQWAKKIPGFDKLCLNDQMALLCNSWMEILLANVIYRSSQLPQSETCSMIQFADGFIMTKEMAKGTERGPLIFNQIANVVDRLRELHVSKGIMVIVKAIILFNSGPSLANRLTLQSPDVVHDLQTTAYDSLHCRIHQEHPGDYRLVYRLLMVLPLIKDVAVTVATIVWIEFKQEQVFMQQLLSEVVRPILQTKMGQVAVTQGGDAPGTEAAGGGVVDRASEGATLEQNLKGGPSFYEEEREKVCSSSSN